MTAFGAIETARLAMPQGAAHYPTKPLDLEELAIGVERTLEGRQLQRDTSQLRQRIVGARLDRAHRRLQPPMRKSG